MYYQIYIKKYMNTYTYESDEKLEIGTFCEVNFSNKETIGVVIRESLEKDLGDFKIKKINKVLEDIPIIPENILKLAMFINSYYITDFYASFMLLGPYEKMSLDRMSKLENVDFKIKNDIELNFEQLKAVENIEKSEENLHLIHGVTGSGKTQVYIRLMEEALKRDEGTIFLVPEISLTTQMVKTIKKVFGDNISIIHSKTTIAKKTKEWERIYSGKSKIVIGARSAIFAPVKNLKYIIIDEEHENTYKQEDNARYHVRNVAIKRSMLDNSKLILGSATPSFESYFYAENNKFNLINLNQRFNGAKLPETIVVDLEKEEGLLSKTLLNEMKETLKRDEQIILILNRKAHSILIKCHDCEEKIKCPRCSVNLQYYKQKNILKCSHCEYTTRMPNKCPYCSSEKLEYLGVGTEKIEEELNQLFGQENILRMDSTTMSSEKAIKQAYTDFLDKKYKIIIGTQIVAKGFHFPDVTLVGIINSDQILQFSDFRAGEKTFQLITQSAGRAGRDKKPGKVIIQTYTPDSILINSIVNNDYISYYNYEMELRKLTKFPPFTKMIKVIVHSKNEEKALKKSESIYKELKNNFDIVSVPDRAGIYKLNEEYRYVIYIKTDNEEYNKNKRFLFNIKKQSTKTVRILVDVDPISMN